MVVPYCEFPLALLHFTGSGHMNRSMRSKADKMVRENTCMQHSITLFFLLGLKVPRVPTLPIKPSHSTLYYRVAPCHESAEI